MTNQPKQTLGSSASPTSGLTKANFDVLFSNPVNIGGNKIARSFPKYDLRITYDQLSSKEYPDFLYIRTQSGNIYELMSSKSQKLESLISLLSKNPHGGKVINGSQQLGMSLPHGFYLFDPKTNTISQVDNPILETGKPYIFKSGNTTPISEIIGVSDSISCKNTKHISSSSFIDYEFQSLSKYILHKPFTVALL